MFIPIIDMALWGLQRLTQLLLLYLLCKEERKKYGSHLIDPIILNTSQTTWNVKNLQHLLRCKFYSAAVRYTAASIAEVTLRLMLTYVLNKRDCHFFTQELKCNKMNGQSLGIKEVRGSVLVSYTNLPVSKFTEKSTMRSVAARSRHRMRHTDSLWTMLDPGQHIYNGV